MKLLFQLIIYLIIVKISHQRIYDRYKIKEIDKVWWKKSVFYQIYPRSFKDSDGDGVGDLKGIISKLDHLKDAGINATWLTPIFKSPMVDFGYDIQDFYLIDPIFGSNNDLKELILQAHELGIKVILDLVPNHTSQNHTWFIESAKGNKKYEDYYIWNDGTIDENGKPKPPNNWLSKFSGSAWTWNEERKAFYYHQFSPAQPDLNYRYPEVRDEMKKIIMHWIEFGVDGFRIDSINHLYEQEHLRDEPEIKDFPDKNNYESLRHIYTKDLQESYDIVREWREMLDEYSIKNPELPYKVIMTEAYTDLNHTNKWYGEEKNHISNIPFNFALILDLNKKSTAKDFENNIIQRMQSKPEWSVMNWILGNHDRSRVGSRYGFQLIDPMNILAMTLPGIPVTYYGEEIGMEDNQDITWEETQDPQACETGDRENYRKYSRDPFRTPFQWDNTTNAGFSDTKNFTWLPVHPNYKNLNLKNQKEIEYSHYKTYQALVRLRQKDEFMYGEFVTRTLRQLFVFTRSTKAKSFYGVAINFGANDDAIDMNDVMDMSDYIKPMATVKIASLLFQNGRTYRAEEVHVPAYQALVFEVRSSGVKFQISSLILLFLSLCNIFI